MCKTPITHLRSLIRILEDLAEEGIELFEHHYHLLEFGSFELVVGRATSGLSLRGTAEIVFSLSVCPSVTNKNTNPSWTHDADFSLPHGEGVFEEIGSQSVYMQKIQC